MSGRSHREARPGTVLAILLLAATPGAFAQSAWDGMKASPVWGNFQWGLAFLQRNGAAMKQLKSSSDYWRVAGGMRLNEEWMVGVGTQHVPLSSWNSMSQLFGTVIFNPDQGPLLYEAGVGKARYKAVHDVGGLPAYENHSGLAVSVGVGYDWTQKIEDVHFGVRLTWEYSRLGPADLGPGSFNHSRLSLGFSASFY